MICKGSVPDHVIPHSSDYALGCFVDLFITMTLDLTQTVVLILFIPKDVM